jgi:hypothetical protein
MEGQQEAGGEDQAAGRVEGSGPAAEAGAAVVQRRFLRTTQTGISELTFGRTILLRTGRTTARRTGCSR